MAEVLAPARLDIRQEFARGFAGMTKDPVTLEELLQVRERFITDLIGRMPDEHRRFLLSFEQGEPDWPLLNLPNAEKLPAVQWRLRNLAQIDPPKRLQLMEALRRALPGNNQRMRA
jgi:hypothetical protein